MRFEFIGTDGSLDFRTGRVYDLDTDIFGRYITIIYPVYCPYASLEAFLRNWRPVYEASTY
jgi:hypothetical protein